MPSIPGICRSNKISEGWREWSCSRKRDAVSAVMTSHPTPSPICSINSRKSTSSSTTSSRFLSGRNTVGLLFGVQDRAHAARQLLDFVGLLQQLDASVEHSTMHDAALAETGGHEHAQIRASLAQFVHELRTKQAAGQHHIGKYQVDVRMLHELFECLLAIGRFEQAVAEAAEHIDHG